MKIKENEMSIKIMKEIITTQFDWTKMAEKKETEDYSKFTKEIRIYNPIEEEAYWSDDQKRVKVEKEVKYEECKYIDH